MPVKIVLPLASPPLSNAMPTFEERSFCFCSVQLRQVCETQSTPLPKGADQLSCSRCECALLPDVNCRVLSGRPKKRPDNRAVLYKCSLCSHNGAFRNASRAAERSARAEQAAREQIERLASETGALSGSGRAYGEGV